MTNFKQVIQQGIPSTLPPKREIQPDANPAPKRKEILTDEERVLALRNALRYFPAEWHQELAEEFAAELNEYGRIYMHRFKPDYKIYARPIEEYPYKTPQAAAIMLMIQNNLDPAVAQHPDELITYGGNGAVFSNWAQYLLTMQYLSEMTEEQTLHMYSGHPMGLFPSSLDAPRVVVTNGMVIPNYSSPDDLERFNALGVSQYGQMTAGSYMYIGPQGIVHGTTITVMNAFRKVLAKGETPAGKIFLTAGLGGMSGAQPKAGNIAGCITICAEVNPHAATKRHEQGWVDVLIDNIDDLIIRVKTAQEKKEVVSIAYIGNVVEIWEQFHKEDIYIHLGSDQTSLHNPWSGGYYPMGLSYEASNTLLREDPVAFKEEVQKTLRRHAAAVNKHNAKGTYFFDYGNAFLLESSRAGADIMAEAFNDAVAAGKIGPVILGRDHHDVSGTDSPYRETSNIYDGSKFTADMAIHNVIGDSFRGATWVSIHNGGGVGWGEVINGGFGMLLDGSPEAKVKLKNMLFYDVNNGIARRSWARNEEAIFAIKREMERTKGLKVTLPNIVDDNILNSI